MLQSAIVARFNNMSCFSSSELVRILSEPPLHAFCSNGKTNRRNALLSRAPIRTNQSCKKTIGQSRPRVVENHPASRLGNKVGTGKGLPPHLYRSLASGQGKVHNHLSIDRDRFAI